MTRLIGSVWFKPAYGITLVQAIGVMQAPFSPILHSIAKGIFIVLIIPIGMKALLIFWKTLPLASKVYRNHPQWLRSRNRRY